VPLWATVTLAYASDILKLGFRAVGLEQQSGSDSLDLITGKIIIQPGNMPWSHGLFMCVVWSILAAFIAYLIYHDKRTSAIVGILVISNWLLDFIVHPPELPLLFNGSPTVGLGLWLTKPGLMIATILEISMLIAGLALYLGNLKRQLFQLFSLVNSLD
jgi:hypothetical protein